MSLFISMVGFGQTWTQLPYYYPQTVQSPQKIFVSPNDVLVAGLKSHPSPESHISLDGGTTWQQIFADKPFMSVEFGPDGTIYFISTKKYLTSSLYPLDTLFTSTNGINWTNIGYKLLAGDHEHDFTISDNNTLLFSKDWNGTNKVFSTSNDNGVSWSLTNVGTGPVTCSYSADTIITSFDSPWPGGLRYSHDGGTTVNVATGINAESIPIRVPNGDVYAATLNQFYKSTDGGMSYTLISSPSSFGFVQEFLYAANGKFYIYVTGAVTGIWETADFTTYTAASVGLPDWSLLKDISVSNNYLYAITDTNLYRLPLSSGTSISESGKEEAFEIFPNPAKENLSIKSPFSGNIVVEIFDLQGKELLRQNIFIQKNATYKLNLNGIPSGTYLISLKNEQNDIQIQKFSLN